MIRFVCDACGEETEKNYVGHRPSSSDIYLEGKSGFCLEIMSGVNGTWNSGELCKDCLFNLVRVLLGKVGK